ncbi:MAG: transposase [Candidatus Brocadiaceae bacterium]|nr:transposase [Candidatus Brocadiaceae bacterium]
MALRHKNDLSRLASIKETVSTHQGLSVGAVWAIHEIARELGIVDALGSTRMPVRCTQTGQGKLALWQVIARVIDNELAAFGYNRDGKRGKRVIVIGLLCDKHGTLLSIEVFEGNTQDPKTFANQIKKVADRFGSGEVTLVGDRGMIKNRQIEDMHEYGFNYITAITKPQIRSLIQQGIFQLGLFDQKLSEVIGDDGVSYH